ncbi:MAG: RNA methyltransferase [Acidimicrobiales bacterium]
MIELAGTNNKVTRLRRLCQRRADREAEGCIVVESVQGIIEALRVRRVEALFVRGGSDPTDKSVQALLGPVDPDIPVFVLDSKTFDGVASTVTPQFAMAVVSWQSAAIGDVAFQQGPVIVLDGVADPGNVGTIVRTADAAGASAVFAGPRNADVTAPKVVRSAAGSLLRVPVVTSLTTADAIIALRARSVRCVGASARGGVSYTDFDWSLPVALVMGSEAHGIDDDVAALLDAEVFIDMAPGAESLNVAMACAVLAFEIRRQRTKGSAR